MRWIRRIPEALALLGAALSLLGPVAVGCRDPVPPPIAASSPEGSPPRRGGVLRLASFADIRSIDPAVSAEAFGAAAMELLYAGLVDYDFQGNVVGDLATRWEMEDGGRTYRFFLREGARFHDGDEVTADDVKRAAERSLHGSTPNPFASFFENLVGYGDYAAGKAEHLAGVEVPSRYVVTFRLVKPDATFLPVLGLAALRPVCKSAGHRYDPSWQPCGAGPFRLPPGGWDRGRSLNVVRHEGYFDAEHVYLDGVTWTFRVNTSTQRFKFEAGDQDLFRELTLPDFLRYTRDPRWVPHGGFEGEKAVWGEGMNTEMAPFDNVEVRRAVAAVIDRKKYALLKPGQVTEATQILPPVVPLHDASFQGQKHDDAGALAHMARAGLPFDPATGKGGWDKVIPYYAYNQGFAEMAAQVLQQELGRIGLRIEIRIVNYPSYLALTRRRHTVAFSPQGWQEDFPDPSDFFEALFSSKGIADEDSNNAAFYRNPRLDALLEEAHGELNPARRKALYRDANAIVCDDAPWAITHMTKIYEVWQPYLRGYRIHPVWEFFVTHTWLDRGGTLPGRQALLGGWR